ncbi:MAG: hypothetical protein NVSMB13_15380 [Mycobacteriales bacterium]
MAAVTGHRALVLGGARSGKSRYAESLLGTTDPVRYVATGYTGDSDPEWLERRRLHQQRRSGHWRTIETVDLAPLLQDGSSPLLVDCLSMWLTQTMDAHDCWERVGTPPAFARAVDELVTAWRDSPATIVGVSSEAGLGVIPPTRVGRQFRDVLGTLNQRLAAVSDQVWFVVAGVPMQMK